MFKIGNIEINSKIVMAPMAGISNSSYRKIIKEMGAGLIVAEMVSDKAIYYKSEKTINMLKMDESERPFSQQIFGSDLESFVHAAKYIEETQKPDIIDINMGCPVPKVAVKSQAGSALLKDVDKIYKIVKAVAESVSVPITVKIRSGWDFDSENAVLVAKTCEKAGAKMIAVHGRTRSQGYSGKVNLEIIKEVKEAVNIPVVGNGDIKTCYDAEYMLNYTGCDAVMIGRALIGNPWIVRDCVNYLEKGIKPIKVTKEEKIEMILKHFKLLESDKALKLALLEIRAFMPGYLKGFKNSKRLKEKVFKINDKETFLKYISDLEEEEYDN